MPITFDTLDELKAFYRAFNLEENAGNGRTHKAATTGVENGLPKKRGRKPGVKMALVKPALKRGPKPKATSLKKAVEPKQKRDKSNTLTAKIQNAIRVFLDNGKSFTANDIYDVLAKKEPAINKQSVITSVLKQMNSTFKHIAVTERAGNGPRPVKLYNA